MKKKEHEYNWLEDAKRKRAAMRNTKSVDIVSWFVILACLGIATTLIWFNGPYQ